LREEKYCLHLPGRKEPLYNLKVGVARYPQNVCKFLTDCKTPHFRRRKYL